MGYSDEIVQQVWENARGFPERDPTEWREDECGAWIRRGHYGSDVSEFGWKIECIEPGEPENAGNLRAFHRDNGFDRGNGRTHCRVTADREGVAPTARVGEPRNKPS